MKKVVKLITVLLIAITLFGCSNNRYELPYYDEIDNGYNVDLFYENNVNAFGADPDCIYIDDPNAKDNGYFYLYPTSDYDAATQALVAYKSLDLTNWESVGIVFKPDEDSYTTQDFWAPEVIFDKDADQKEYGIGEGKGVYYLFFSSNDKNNPNELVFETHAIEKQYRDIEKRINSLSYGSAQSQLNSYISAYKNKSGSLFKKDFFSDAMIIIEDYEHNIKQEGANKQTLVKEALLGLATIDIDAMTVRNDYGIGLAVSASPDGPFIQYKRENPKEGERLITKNTPFLCSEDMYEYADAKNKVLKLGEEGFSMIDPHPFVDPVSGKKFLFLVRRCSRLYIEGSFVVAVEMGDSWSDDPKWETLTRLTSNNLVTPYGDEICDTDVEQHLINEGPYVYYKDGTYFLTYSVGNYNNTTYSTCQAISDNVLGEYRKLMANEGGYVLTADGRSDVSAPGHHSFVEYNDELYVVYHAHWDKETNTGQRGFYVDKVYFTKNNEGQLVIQCNGGTSTPQPLIGEKMKYKNIISDAKISGKNIEEDTLANLADGKIDCYSYVDFVKECKANKNAKITIEFDDYRIVRSIMIYNSKDAENAFKQVEEIDFYFKDNDGNQQIAVIKNLRFNQNNINDVGLMNRCSAAIAEFNELEVNKIELKFNEEKDFEINEIYVLGK